MVYVERADKQNKGINDFKSIRSLKPEFLILYVRIQDLYPDPSVLK